LPTIGPTGAGVGLRFGPTATLPVLDFDAGRSADYSVGLYTTSFADYSKSFSLQSLTLTALMGVITNK